MIKREELTNPNSCMSRALPEERTFVLLARDEAAPVAIRTWASHRIAIGKNQPGDPQMVEAFQCADLMDRERSNVKNAVKFCAQPSATQPSGNTGEPVCATCRDTKRVPFVYGHEYDCAMSTTKPCPDCYAAQPATEQPRIWRVAWNPPQCATGEGSEHWARRMAAEFAPEAKARPQYSTDNGKTWIDEQAEREGK